MPPFRVRPTREEVESAVWDGIVAGGVVLMAAMALASLPAWF